MTLVHAKKFGLNLESIHDTSTVSDFVSEDLTGVENPDHLQASTFLKLLEPLKNRDNVGLSNSRVCNNPQKVLVRSYGVYGVSSELEFSSVDWMYLENNYIIAIPHIRGGSDLGADWHTVTYKTQKHVSVNDLQDCFYFLTGKFYIVYLKLTTNLHNIPFSKEIVIEIYFQINNM